MDVDVPTRGENDVDQREQTEHNDPGAMMPSLRAKLRTFADGLTPEEAERLRGLPTEIERGEHVPALRAKLQRTVDGLTPEEQAQLHLLLQRCGEDAAPGAAADVRGYMNPVYAGPFGWKGPPHLDPEFNNPGGGNSGAFNKVPIVGDVIAVGHGLPTWGKLLGETFGF